MKLKKVYVGACVFSGLMVNAWSSDLREYSTENEGRPSPNSEISQVGNDSSEALSLKNRMDLQDLLLKLRDKALEKEERILQDRRVFFEGNQFKNLPPEEKNKLLMQAENRYIPGKQAFRLPENERLKLLKDLMNLHLETARIDIRMYKKNIRANEQEMDKLQNPNSTQSSEDLTGTATMEDSATLEEQPDYTINTAAPDNDEGASQRPDAMGLPNDDAATSSSQDVMNDATQEENPDTGIESDALPDSEGTSLEALPQTQAQKVKSLIQHFEKTSTQNEDGVDSKNASDEKPHDETRRPESTPDTKENFARLRERFEKASSSSR